MKRIILLLAIFIVAGCGIFRPRPVIVQTDSVRVEYRDRIVTVRDSVKVEVPLIVEKNVTRDSVSHIENEWLVSDAAVKDGLLHHSAETKPHKIYVPYEVQVPVHDTLIVEGHSQERIVEVERKLTPFQKLFIALGKVLIGVLVVFLMSIIVKKIER